MIATISNGNKDTKWDLEVSVEMFRATEELQNWVLWKAKKDLVFGELEEFLNILNINRRTLERKVEYFEAQKTLSITTQASQTLNETEAICIVTDEKNPINDIKLSTYSELKGDTPKEKVEFYQEVKEATQKENPSRDNVREYKKSINHIEEQISVNDALKQIEEEFGEDYMELGSSTSSGSLSMLTIGIELMKYIDSWKKIYRELSKVAHPDLDGDAEVQQFVNWLNELFKDRRKHLKNMSKHDNMTNRFAELVKQNG